jgi:iron complex transport system substrate-binding protein
MKRFLYSLIVFGVLSCTPNVKTKEKKVEGNGSIGYDYASQIRYAKGFTIEKKRGYKELTVFNPWKNDVVLRKYALIAKGRKINDSIPPGTTVIKVPVESLAIFSNTHIGPIVKLGLEDKLIGMTRASKVFDKGLYARVENGEIANVGGAHNKNLDIEKIIELDPELIILSAYNEVKAGVNQLEEIGMNMAYSLNWMEETPLGRAEWIKFTAAFFNKEKLADSLFNEVETNYNELKTTVANISQKPNVLLGWSYKGTWYMPGGKNYMVSYLRDAGADYFLFDDDSRGNIPMSLESVLDKCDNTDIWIYPGTCKSMNDIENSGKVFTQFKAYQKGEVYNIYKRANPYGGSDWWESGSVNPDVVLKDFIQILHPDLYPNDSTHFLSRLRFRQ